MGKSVFYLYFHEKVVHSIPDINLSFVSNIRARYGVLCGFQGWAELQNSRYWLQDMDGPESELQGEGERML